MVLLSGCAEEKTFQDTIKAITSSQNDSLEPVKYEDIINDGENGSKVPIQEKNTALVKKEWWKPLPNTTWQWQLEGELNLNYDVEMYDLDLFDTSKETIDALHQRGIKVICYFSAGSYENWRSDSNEFPSTVLGNTLEGWEDEKWLDIFKIDLLAPIMIKRLDLAVEKRCDGVEPDNVDGYLNDNGFSLTSQDQLEYNQWLAEEAHRRGLSIGLKNDLDQIPELVHYFDFSVNEQCFEYDECEQLLPFIEQGKAVFGVEYELEPLDFCEKANKLNFSWLKMEYELDGGRIACR
ncbi:endo alpha-1,4 polygalactosaminidase [Candidatus Woesearchaeota archaeon]|nr:endo alpha-1,4 polygalactosaminidase [Candidatus Woesearchaeota archaeon]